MPDASFGGGSTTGPVRLSGGNIMNSIIAMYKSWWQQSTTKAVSFGPLQGQAVFIQHHNGQVTAQPTIGPPPLPTPAQICPNPNWSISILRLTYENVVLHIQQQGQDILAFNFGNVDP
jgi:hypothetical protein